MGFIEYAVLSCGFLMWHPFQKILDMAYILIYILIIKIFDMQNILNLFKHKEEKKR